MRHEVDCSPDSLVGDERDETSESEWRTGLTGVDLIGLAVAAILPIAYAPQLGGPTTTPRLAVAMLAMPLGVTLLVQLGRAGERRAWAAAALLLASFASALVNVAPVQSIKGSILAHFAWVLLLAGIALWAVGRGMSPRGRELLGAVVIGSASVNVLLGVVQVALTVDSGPLATSPGRASGLLANAAFYGCAIVGPAAYAAVRSSQRHTLRWLIAAMWMSFGVGISGSRGVIGSMLLLGITGLVATRFRAWRTSGAVIGGLGLALGFTSLVAGDSAVARVATGETDGRLDVWSFALAAWADRPVFGWGFANFGYAVRPHFTEEFTRASAWDDQFMSWQDPHNLVAMLLVTTGAVGLAAAGWFVVEHLRRSADVAYLAAFFMMVSGWMLQPATVHSLPIAMLLLGAAVSWPAAPRLEGRVPHVALFVGAALFLLLIVPNALGVRALRENNPTRAEAAFRWYPGDPVLANEVAWAYADRALEYPSTHDHAVERSTLPLDIDPYRPLLWAHHARRMIQLGEYDLVLPALARAFELERWNPSAWEAKLGYALAIQDYGLADETREVICRLDLAMCATGSRFPLQLELDDG